MFLVCSKELEQWIVLDRSKADPPPQVRSFCLPTCTSGSQLVCVSFVYVDVQLFFVTAL